MIFRQLRKAIKLRRSSRSPEDNTDPEIFFFRGLPVEVRRRAYRRSIGVTLKVNGTIKVIAPRTVSFEKIQSFLESHSEWIHTHLERYKQVRNRYPQKRFEDGETFLFLGVPLVLRFRFVSSGKFRVARVDAELVCEIPSSVLPGFRPADWRKEIRSAIVAFYERSGRSVLEERVRLLSAQMNLFPKALSFRSQKTRWGSCSSKGRLSLNWRLIVAPMDIIDYVVIHELAHLRYYNHSAEFWSLVETHCPTYAELRNWLKLHQFEADFLARVSELHPMIASQGSVNAVTGAVTGDTFRLL